MLKRLSNFLLLTGVGLGVFPLPPSSTLSLLSITPQLTIAQLSAVPEPSDEPLASELLEAEELPGGNIVTSNTLSQSGISDPSFWWAIEQMRGQFEEFGGRLIGDWIAYPDKRRVDVVVNRQLWSLLDYIDRYRFLHQFGTLASDYDPNHHYDVRLFNPQGDRLGAYTCNYAVSPPDCEIRVCQTSGLGSRHNWCR